MKNITNVPDEIIDLYDNAVTLAALSMGEDEYEDYVLRIDPDGRLYRASLDRMEARESARRAALSADEQAAEQAHDARLVEIGMQVLRRKLAEKSW